MEIFMNNRKKNVRLLYELFYIGATGTLCFYIYCWGASHEKARFAITLGATAYLVLCLKKILFDKKYDGMFEKLLSGLIIIAFSNELYNYNKVIALFPVFKETDPLLFSFIVLGTMLFLLIIIKIMTLIYGNTNAENDNMKREIRSLKLKGDNTLLILYFVFMIILICTGGALFSILYDKGMLKQNYDFFEVVSVLLKYAGYIVMIFLAIVLVIILLIEMIKLIVSRIKVFAVSLKNDGQENDIPLYLLSIIIDIVICYLTYKFTGINIDSFYNFANGGKYMALPLLILFIGVAFIIFLRLIHATLILLVDMKPENIKLFLRKVNEKNKIADRIVGIIQKIIDIIFDTALIALNFVSFIPHFFNTLCIFVLEDENDFVKDEDEERDF